MKNLIFFSLSILLSGILTLFSSPFSELSSGQGFLEKFTSIKSALAQTEDDPWGMNAPVLWNVNGWIKINIAESYNNELVILDNNNQELPLEENSFLVTGLWKFTDPLSYVIYELEAFENSNYILAIKKNDSNQINLQITTYTNETETKNTFNINSLNETYSILSFQDINSNQSIRINNQLYFPDTTETTAISEKDRTVKAEASSEVNFDTTFPDTETNTGFLDVDKSHPNYDAIEYTKSQNIVKGYDDGTFQPGSSINRAEFTKIIMEATTDIIHGSNCFPDVKDEWFAPYVCAAKSLGIAQGYPDGKFKPTNNLSFAEAAKMTVAAFDLPTEPDEIWFKPFVKKLEEKKAIPTDIKNFDDFLSRGDMAEIIYRLSVDNLQKESLGYNGVNSITIIKRASDRNIWAYYYAGEKLQVTTTGGRTDLCNNGTPLDYTNPVLSEDEQYVLLTAGCEGESSEIYVKEISSMTSKKIADGYKAEFFNQFPWKNAIKIDNDRQKIYENPFLIEKEKLLQKGVPEWVIDTTGNNTAIIMEGQSLEISKCTYKDETVYYFIPAGADVYNPLFTSTGEEICAPDGGITGGGDGNCTDFSKNTCELIWEK